MRSDEEYGGDVLRFRPVTTNPTTPAEAGQAQLFYKTGTGWCFRNAAGTVYKLQDMANDQSFTFGDSSTPPTLLYNSTRTALVLDPKGFAVEVRGLNMARDRYELVERFQKAPKINADILSATEATNEVCNRDFEVLGTNAASTDVTLYAEGGIAIATHGATNDSTIILPHLDTGESAWSVTTWGTDQKTRWECVIQTPAAVTSVMIWAGLKLTNTPVGATDNDQAYFLFDTGASGNATYWHTWSSNNNTDEETAITVDAAGTAVAAVAAATNYHLVVDIDSSRVPYFYINGVLVKVGAALKNTTDLIPYVGIKDLSAGSARVLYLFKEAISRKPGV